MMQKNRPVKLGDKDIAETDGDSGDHFVRGPYAEKVADVAAITVPAQIRSSLQKLLTYILQCGVRGYRPSSSRYFSTSRAAMQPVPAAVMA